jgi:hypothetical protein
VHVARPTLDQFDETLALLRAADVAVYGDSDWTECDLREGWDGLELEQDAWLVRVDSRLADVAHLLERRDSATTVSPDSRKRRNESRRSARPSPRRRHARRTPMEPIQPQSPALWGKFTVDAENPTGALRLYEHAGMRVLWRADVWEKELRAGA